MEKPDDFLNVAELAAYLKIPKSTLYKSPERAQFRVRKWDGIGVFISKPLIIGWEIGLVISSLPLSPLTCEALNLRLHNTVFVLFIAYNNRMGTYYPNYLGSYDV